LVDVLEEPGAATGTLVKFSAPPRGAAQDGFRTPGGTGADQAQHVAAHLGALFALEARRMSR
jgi:hypothetical protein